MEGWKGMVGEGRGGLRAICIPDLQVLCSTLCVYQRSNNFVKPGI
jgi:hypothetical protein